MVDLVIWLISALVVLVFAMIVLSLVALVWRYVLIGIALVIAAIFFRANHEIGQAVFWIVATPLAILAFVPQEKVDEWARKLVGKSDK